MVQTTFVAVALGFFSAASALEVITPAADDMVVADKTYTIEWTGTGEDGYFDIDLYYCGSLCTEDDCGEWVTALCPYAATGCPDSEGDYDVVMPEPLSGLSGSGYKVRVADANDESYADCSDEFYLMASEEAPSVDDVDGPYLFVTAPASGDEADAGEVYTVEFDYDNGLGSSVDRFAIDLYESTGSGDCGTWVVSICDKPTIGCKDSMGDYDVEIPEDTTSGMYKIRVGLFDNDELFGCSDEFKITSIDDDDSGGSMSYIY